VRRFGTNNFPDCSNMCHEPTSVGLPESIGIGKGTVILDDFSHRAAAAPPRWRPTTSSCDTSVLGVSGGTFNL
jgi:hypothetical protein